MSNHEWKHELNKSYPAGTRIELERMDDPYRRMPTGLKGTVNFVDDAGQIHVTWENGISLALVPGEDSFHKLPEPKREIVGSVSFASGETFNYTDADEYIDVVKEELPYRSTSGFQFTTLTDDPRVRKAVDDLVYN